METSNQVTEIRMDLIEQEREALRRDIMEGCAAMWDVSLEMAHEYESLEEDADRAFDAQS